MAKEQEKRSRNWCVVVYPDSAPENWREIIDETHIEWVESPIHDRDTNPDGEIKKAHWHIVLLYPSLKSKDQIQELTGLINAPSPEKCLSVKGSVRYMTHKDNPEKAQYAWADIKCHGGVDIDSVCKPTATERQAIQEAIIDYIRQNRITEFMDIVEYARDHNSDWFNVLMNQSTLSIATCVRSMRHKLREENGRETARNQTLPRD